MFWTFVWQKSMTRGNCLSLNLLFMKTKMFSIVVKKCGQNLHTRVNQGNQINEYYILQQGQITPVLNMLNCKKYLIMRTIYICYYKVCILYICYYKVCILYICYYKVCILYTFVITRCAYYIHLLLQGVHKIHIIHLT